MMTALGLLLIVFAWILQLIQLGKSSKLHVLFLFTYCAGVGFLVMDNFMSGDLIVGSLNMLTLCLVTLLLLKVRS